MKDYEPNSVSDSPPTLYSMYALIMMYGMIKGNCT
jgi:hypothetical protein